MKTLILLSALAIIGTIGLECYENKPHSPFNAEKTSVTSKANINTHDRLFNPSTPINPETDNTKLPCDFCVTAAQEAGLMQSCFPSAATEIVNACTKGIKGVTCCKTDRCNNVELKMIRCIHGTSKTLVSKVSNKDLYKALGQNQGGDIPVECGACTTPSMGRPHLCIPISGVEIICKANWAHCCYENECNQRRLECYEKDIDSTGVNKKKVSSTTVERFLKIMGDQDPQDLAKLENAKGKGEVECESCFRAQGNGKEMQACAIDIGVCNLMVNTLKQKAPGTSAGCCETDGCNRIGGTSSNSNGNSNGNRNGNYNDNGNSGDQLNVNLVFILFSLLNPISPFPLFPF